MDNLSNLTIESSWNGILQQTNNFKQAIDENRWQIAAELAATRHQTIQKHFKNFPVGPETADFYQKHLSTFMQQEESYRHEAQRARKQAMREGLVISNNKKAISAYGR